MNRNTVRVLGPAIAVGAVTLTGVTAAFGSGSTGTLFGQVTAGAGSGRMMNGSYHTGMMNWSGSQNIMNVSGPGRMMPGPGDMVRGWSQTSTSGETISIGQARQNVRRYIEKSGKTNLALDEIMEFQRNFYAIIKDTSTGHGAMEVLVNKYTGTVFPEFGPAMMWNTQYGMMSRGMGRTMGYGQPSGPMPVSTAKAGQIARLWLDTHKSGSSAESPDQFPGYYTIHFRHGGKIAGMLSVNGYTGQVWYHTWHGAFVG